MRGNTGLLASGAAEGEADTESCDVFGDTGVFGCVLLLFIVEPAPRADAPVAVDVASAPVFDVPRTRCSTGAGPAPARVTDEHTVHLEIHSRAADLLQPTGSG